MTTGKRPHRERRRAPHERNVLRPTLLGLGLMAFALALVALVLLRDPMPRFLERRSSLSTADARPSSFDHGYILTPVHVTATSGLAVDLVVRRAASDSGRVLPLAVILGGERNGWLAAHLIGDTRGVVVATLSYPFTGDMRPTPLTFVREIPAIRDAFLDTPPAIQLALDYLLTLPGVDRRQVEAVGVSLGAPFMCIAGALDQRFTRVWVIHGSGGSYAPLEANMRREIPFAPLRVVAASISNVIIAGPRLDPTLWAPRIAPRQFMMVNALDDERLPRSAVDALFRSAGEPKEHIWMAGAHVHGDSATINRIVSIVMPRVRATAAH